MRTSQMLLLMTAFLVLASDAVTKASAAVEGDPCVSSIIPSPKPCDNKSCNKACIDHLMWSGGHGECVAEGCKCLDCVKMDTI
ncbi:hypothetical protein CFC21_075653 [Triticum aestivum]|uniref:Knottin scorpion toxin-like domain-containing protein n=2 Tax=Triticum aestivum TaxID=4565 RepID=A0A9R1KXL4_WHEAT|nr:hypothetical protein CFC21_075653 [Triticum aestivum]